MPSKIKITVALTGWLFCAFGFGFCQNPKEFPFEAEVLEDRVNIRSDATVISQVICTVDKGDLLNVAAEFYDWYKVALPKNAPAFIKGELVLPVDSRTVRVIKERVNIRLQPDESAPIIGRAKKDEILNFVAHTGGWYNIIPSDSCFGWLHKKFLSKHAMPKVEEIKLPEAKPEPINTEVETQKIIIEPAELPMPAKEGKVTIAQEPAATLAGIIVEGIVMPYGKVFKRLATHKLITRDKRIFLLLSPASLKERLLLVNPTLLETEPTVPLETQGLIKADKALLNAATYRKARVSGKIIPELKDRYPVIEVSRLEVLE